MLKKNSAAQKSERQTIMRVTGQIPLRYFRSLRARFTLPIRKKARPLSLYPFSLKKLTGLGWKYDDPQSHQR
jgi:hypothetical protein